MIFFKTNPPTMTMNTPATSGYLSNRPVPERIEMRRVDAEQEEDEDDWDSSENPACHAPLSRENLHEPTERHSGADVGHDLVEHLGHVPACLALEHRDDRDLVDVGVAHAAGRHLERVVESDAKLLVCDDAPELRARRLGRLVDHDRHRADEAVPGTEG